MKRDTKQKWKIIGGLVLPQEVSRQRIQMTGVKEKEDPYRKCIERERVVFREA